MAESSKDDRSTSLTYGIVAGLLLGTVLSSATGQWWMLSIGVALGVALGLTVDLSRLFGSDD